MSIAQMPFLALAYLDGNKFRDLEKVSFTSPYVEVLDMSNNQVGSKSRLKMNVVFRLPIFQFTLFRS